MIELLIILVSLGILLWLVQFALPSGGGLNKTHYSKRWREITELLAGGTSGQKLAVIEADKLLGQALKAKGIRGETMGDRLKNAGRSLGNQNEVWQAHRLRNRLVHEEAKLSKSQALSALNAFKKCLKNLGAL